jgi:hypothetical protein
MESAKELLDTVPQRGVFVAKHVAVCTLSAMAFGITGGVLGAYLAPNNVGPLVPYLVCSASGFAFSSYMFWRTERRLAMHFVREYPKLMMHHFRVGHPEQYLSLCEYVHRKQQLSASGANVGGGGGGHGSGASTVVSAEELLAVMNGSSAVVSWLILARQTAANDIAGVHDQICSALVDSYVQQAAAAEEGTSTRNNDSDGDAS